jgi:hypothetical protein
MVACLILLLGQADDAWGELMVWDANINLLPHALSPTWTYYAAGSGETPSITSGLLTLRSANNVGDYAAFSQSATDLVVPTNLWLEAKTRWVSGSNFQPSRSHICMAVTTEPNIGNGVWIVQDRIFVMTGLWTEGQSANVDTDGACHTYRIEVQGTSVGSPLQVYYDGVLTLTGTLYSSAAGNGSVPRIFWGDGTSYEGGVSEWEYVAHNAAAVPGVWLWGKLDPLGYRVAWSTATYGFHLQRTTNLVLSSSWQDATNTPMVIGHEKSVIVSDMERGFFRLKSP